MTDPENMPIPKVQKEPRDGRLLFCDKFWLLMDIVNIIIVVDKIRQKGTKKWNCSILLVGYAL